MIHILLEQMQNNCKKDEEELRVYYIKKIRFVLSFVQIIKYRYSIVKKYIYYSSQRRSATNFIYIILKLHHLYPSSDQTNNRYKNN